MSYDCSFSGLTMVPITLITGNRVLAHTSVTITCVQVCPPGYCCNRENEGKIAKKSKCIDCSISTNISTWRGRGGSGGSSSSGSLYPARGTSIDIDDWYCPAGSSNALPISPGHCSVGDTLYGGGAEQHKAYTQVPCGVNVSTVNISATNPVVHLLRLAPKFERASLGQRVTIINTVPPPSSSAVALSNETVYRIAYKLDSVHSGSPCVFRDGKRPPTRIQRVRRTGRRRGALKYSPGPCSMCCAHVTLCCVALLCCSVSCSIVPL